MRSILKERFGLIVFLSVLAMMLVAFNIQMSILDSGDIYRITDISLEFTGLMILTILSSLLVIEPVVERRRFLFAALMFSEAVMLIADIVYWYTLPELNDLHSELLWSVAECMQIVVYICFLAHTYEAYLGWSRSARRVMGFMFFVLAVSAVLGFTNNWTGLVCGPDERGIIHGHIVHYLVALVLIGVVANTLNALRKRGGFHITTVLLALFMVLPIFGFFLQDMVDDISFSIAFTSYGITFIVTAGFVRRGHIIEYSQGKRDMQYAEALTKQIAPHFIFNSLSAIMNLPDNDDESREIIEYFSMYLRNSLDAIMLIRPIPFAREMEQVETFVNLKKTIYGDRINITYEISDTGFTIPSLTVRTIVSYFIRDNLDTEGTPLSLTISTKKMDEKHLITINNVTATDTSRDIFLELIADPSNSVVANRVAMLNNGTIRHIIGSGNSVSVEIEIPGAV